MTERYERKCWHCGSKDMENKGDYVQCASCGATWNYVPEGGSLPITVDTTKIMKRGTDVTIKSYRPSVATTRQAAKVRTKGFLSSSPS